MDSFRHKSVLIFILSNMVRFTASSEGDLKVSLQNSVCDTEYSSNDWRNLYITFNGLYLMDPCVIRVENEDTSSKVLCISTHITELECGTKLEYHEYHFNYYGLGQRTFSCYNSGNGEWCSEQYVDKVFIALKNERRSSQFQLRIYTKYNSGLERFFETPEAIVIVTLCPLVVFIIITSIACYICYRNRRKRERGGFQATMQAVSLDTGDSSQHGAPRYRIISQDERHTDSEISQRYTVNPLQRAELVEHDSNQGARIPTAPQPEPHPAPQLVTQPASSSIQQEQPPPSYDSLWR